MPTNSLGSVTHRGRILRIEGDTVTLLISDDCRSDCGGCLLNAMCNGSIDNSSRVTVTVDKMPATLRVGDNVEALVSPATQRLALVLNIIVPIIIICAVVVPLAIAGFPEWSAVGLGVAGVAIWELLLWLYHRRHPGTVVWTINKV